MLGTTGGTFAPLFAGPAPTLSTTKAQARAARTGALVTLADKRWMRYRGIARGYEARGTRRIGRTTQIAKARPPKLEMRATISSFRKRIALRSRWMRRLLLLA